jgi:dihydrofolate reductase
MVRVRAHNISTSLDGYMAGPDQSVTDPLGVGGERLHEWAFPTSSGSETGGQTGGLTGVDKEMREQGSLGVGATVMGRNMFGPIRGPWEDDEWKGWWGDDPPFHRPVFVLTHHPHDPIEMAGGTTFLFVTDGIHAALERAIEAADGGDVVIGGGASTLRQYLAAGLIDDLHVAVVPAFLGGGERLFEGSDGGMTGYELAEIQCSQTVAHMHFRRNTGSGR